MLLKSKFLGDYYRKLTGIYRLIGVNDGAESIPSLPGNIVGDNVSVTTALEQLEAAIEDKDWIGKAEIS